MTPPSNEPPARPRGRPAQDWRLWPSLADVPIGSALLIDSGDKHARLIGRLMLHTPFEIHLVDRRLTQQIVTPETFHRARVVEGLFHRDDPCYLRGETIRIAVVDLRGAQVLVEYPDGSVGWLDETLVEHADDRLAKDLGEAS